MSDVDVNNFDREKQCDYKNEHYSVRDNGAVLRHPKPGQRVRPLDNQWTFGKVNSKTGYLEIATIRVHRIIATAFHGSPPSEDYVVDHIDTNRQNNRPENLRWVTRLENILLNPITRKKIEYYCGSIENFLHNPSLLPSGTIEQNFSWMRRVSKEEATLCWNNMQKWLTKSNYLESKGKIGEWIFHNTNTSIAIFSSHYIQALTLNAMQENWKIPTKFLFCPTQIKTDTPILEYLNNIQFGQVCIQNKTYHSIAISASITLDKKTMWVITNNSQGLKPWGIFRVTYGNDKFLHKNLGTFFEQRGAEKCLCLECGQHWDGPDGIDDYC